MEQQYLMDTNVVIDYLGNKLPPGGSVFIDNLFPVISVISRIEILGWFGSSPTQLARLNAFVNCALVFTLTENIILKTIAIRQEYKIKTPDAIIAATPVVHNHILLSHNNKDFKAINERIVLDPHQMQTI
jgi:predicted nucleic acid-binding protein